MVAHIVKRDSPGDLLERLQAPESSGRLKAVRSIRDQVIGNRSRKLAYLRLGVVQRLIELLSDPEAESLIRINCAATVGSLAYGIEDGLRAVIASGGVAHLIQLLSSLDERVVEASVRALKMVVAHHVSSGPLFSPYTPALEGRCSALISMSAIKKANHKTAYAFLVY